MRGGANIKCAGARVWARGCGCACAGAGAGVRQGASMTRWPGAVSLWLPLVWLIAALVMGEGDTWSTVAGTGGRGAGGRGRENSAQLGFDNERQLPQGLHVLWLLSIKTAPGWGRGQAL